MKNIKVLNSLVKNHERAEKELVRFVSTTYQFEARSLFREEDGVNPVDKFGESWWVRFASNILAIHECNNLDSEKSNL